MGNYVYGGLAVTFAFFFLRSWRESKTLPPGPKPWFILGNLFDFPLNKPWLTYTEWRKQYGDVVYMTIFGRSIVVLNSFKAATDLLDKRSLIYSDRPRAVMLTELVGWEFSMSVMNYTPRWRAHRKLFHRYFNENTVHKYQPGQERSTHDLLRRLLHDPEHFLDHLRTSFAAAIMDAMYGIRVEGPDDVFVKTAEEALKGAAAASNPGSFLVDLLPALKYVPTWFPGAGFHQKAAGWRVPTLRLRSLPFEHVQRNLADGTARPSVMASMLDTSPEEKSTLEASEGIQESFDDVAANVAGVGYAAGADTTLSLTQAFFLVMAKYPHVQKAAQEELDRVIGHSRLPSFDDTKYLPYVNAIIKELLRWHSATPLGIPHSLSEDDVYEGYFLPKGTIVIANLWSMLNDPVVYSDPRDFDPSRWLVETATGLELHNDLPDPRDVAFGFGRRVCPGRHFAEDSMFLMVSNVLSCFNVSPPLDESGKPVYLKGEMTGAALSYPVPFEVRIVPRTPEVTQLIEETASV